MNEIDKRSHLAEKVDTSELMEVVVAVKCGDLIKVYEGLADQFEIGYEDDNLFWRTDNASYTMSVSQGRSMSIHFFDSISVRNE